MNDEAAERERLAAAVQPPASPPHLSSLAREIAGRLAFQGAGNDELVDASKAVIDLICAGKLDEAERAARDLVVRFPDEHDGYDCLGMVHETRGENRQAADCYRKIVALIHDHPDDYDPGFETFCQQRVDELDPPAERVP